MHIICPASICLSRVFPAEVRRPLSGKLPLGIYGRRNECSPMPSRVRIGGTSAPQHVPRRRALTHVGAPSRRCQPCMSAYAHDSNTRDHRAPAAAAAAALPLPSPSRVPWCSGHASWGSRRITAPRHRRVKNSDDVRAEEGRLGAKSLRWHSGVFLAEGAFPPSLCFVWRCST